MPDMSRAVVNGTGYTLKDKTARKIISDLEKGRYYIQSTIVSGSLDSSGQIAENTKRATFEEYIELPYACQVRFADGYGGIVCTYTSQHAFSSTETIAAGSTKTVPASTPFRVTIYVSGEPADVPDVTVFADKCVLAIAAPTGYTPVTSSGDLNDLKKPGYYSVDQVAANVPVPADRQSGLAGVLIVYETASRAVYQLYFDYRQNNFCRRYSASEGWSAWVQYEKHGSLDTVPTAGSTKAVTSGGIKTYVDTTSKQPIELTGANDLNQVRTSGFYGCVTSPLPANWPVAAGQSGGAYGYVQVYALSDTAASIQCVEDYRNHFFIRRYSPSSGWTAWVQMGTYAEIEAAIQANVEPLADTVKDLGSGDHYIQSPIQTGYLDASGQIASYNKRAVFTEYIQIPHETQVVLDDGYTGTICLYDENKALASRATFNSAAPYTVPADTFFRVCIFKVAEEVISDASEYAKKCRLLIAFPFGVQTLSASDDLNNVKQNGMYSVNGIGSNVPVPSDRSSALFGILSVIASTNGNIYQVYTDYYQNLFVRRLSSSMWSSWVQYAKVTDIEAASATKPLAAKVFKRVGCIGDSYTEGYINAGGQVAHANDYSWPHFMEALTGNIWTNFGIGGSSAKTWIDGGAYSKLTEVQASGNKCQAYVIGLMINDSNSSAHAYVPVGTAEDIGTDANSYYAYYYKLIQAVHSVNAQAPIFCNTCPQNASRFTAYNTAVRNIVAYCKNNGLPVYLCDLASSKYNTAQYYAHPVFTTDSINGHYTGIGYEMMAECYLRVLSEVVLENVTDFQTVHLIPYDPAQ